MKWLTFVVVCDHAREWLGGLPWVRPQSAGRPTVALRKTQESPNFPLLHGEKVLELHAALNHHHRCACCLWRVLWKSCFHLPCDCLNSLMSLSSSLFTICSLFFFGPAALFNCAFIETTTHVTDVSPLQCFIMEDRAWGILSTRF